MNARYLAALALVAVAGCTSRQPSSHPPAVADASTPEDRKAEVEEAAVPPTSSTLVEILDPGQEPRAKLRYPFRVGDAVRVQSRSTTRLLEPAEQLISETTSTYDVRVVEASGDSGVVLVEFDVLLGELQALPLPHGHREDDALHVTVRAGVTSTGQFFSPEINVDGRPELSTDLRIEAVVRRSFLIVWLPVEPVGVGSRWRTVTSEAVGELAFEKVGQVSLEERDGSSMVLRRTGTQTAPAQEVTMGGETRKILLQEIKGTASYVIDLDAPAPFVPRKVEFTTETRQEIERSDGFVAKLRGQTQLEAEVINADE